MVETKFGGIGGNLIWRMQKNVNFGGNLIWRMQENVNFGGNLIWRMAKNIFLREFNLANKQKILGVGRF